MDGIIRRREMIAPEDDGSLVWTPSVGTFAQAGFTFSVGSGSVTYSSDYATVSGTNSTSTCPTITYPSAYQGVSLSVEVDAEVTSNFSVGDPSGIGIKFGGTGHYAQVRTFATVNGGSAWITRYTDGSWKTLSSNAAKYTQNTKYLLKADYVIGGAFTFYKDGVSVFTTNNRSTSSNTNALQIIRYTFNIYRIKVTLL